MKLLMLVLLLNLGAEHSVEVGPSENLNVLVAGTGDPVVLLPGLSGCAYGYRNVVGSLGELGFSTVIVEPLGMGSSSRPRGADYSLTAQADRVAAVMDELEIEGAIIVGHGVSASIALRLAYRRPELARAVLSIEGGAYESAVTPALERTLKFASVVAKLGGGRLLKDKYRKNLEEASGDKSWIDRKTLGRYLKNIDHDLGDFITALQAMAASAEPAALVPNLARVRCPVLLLTGEAPHAGTLTPAEIATLAEGLPHFESRAVPGSGHFIFEEQPAVVVGAIKAIGQNEGRLSCAQ